MPTTTTPKKSVGMVRVRQNIVVVVGAAPGEYYKRIVRDNRTGRLAEIDWHERGWKVEPVDGTTYAFAKGEEVEADHPAVLDRPGGFVAVEERTGTTSGTPTATGRATRVRTRGLQSRRGWNAAEPRPNVPLRESEGD